MAQPTAKRRERTPLPQGKLEEKIGYRFSDPSLLTLALTHSSYMKERLDHGMDCSCNQRLEFLGDSVLSLITSRYLYLEHPSIPEGDLSSIRAKVVDEKALPAYAKSIRLGEFLLTGHGRTVTDKMLEDAFEALIGAIYLDGGLDAARTFALAHLADAIVSVLQSGTWQDDKTLLQQIVQQKPGEELTYSTVDRVGPDHAPVFTVEARLNGTVIGRGTASSIKKAEQLAARDARLTYFGGV